jgi:predicted GIY-YIG superfamily endonuclease
MIARMCYNKRYLKGCTRAASTAGCVSNHTYLKGAAVNDSTSVQTCFVYLIESSSALKIGIAANPQQRLSDLQTSHHEKLSLRYTLECPDRAAAFSVEQLLHRRFDDERLNGEWFDVDAQTVIDELSWSLAVGQFVTATVVYQMVEVVEYKRVELAPAQPYALPDVFRRLISTARALVRRDISKTREEIELAGRKGASPKLELAMQWLKEHPEDLALSSRKIAGKLGVSKSWVAIAKKFYEEQEGNSQ